MNRDHDQDRDHDRDPDHDRDHDRDHALELDHDHDHDRDHDHNCAERVFPNSDATQGVLPCLEKYKTAHTRVSLTP